MKKWLPISVMIFCLGGAYFYLYWGLPSDETVVREFKERSPSTEVTGVECIFDFEPKPVLLYLVRYKNSGNDDIKLGEVRMRQSWNPAWHWCDDRTERKCI